MKIIEMSPLCKPRTRNDPRKPNDQRLFLRSPTHRTLQLIDLVVRVVERERRAHRGLEAVAIHRRLCAMMSRAHRDTVLIEDLAHLFCRNLVGDERDDTRLL